MLYAVGFEKEDFKKPQIGIASTWEVTPCNIHIDKLAIEARGARTPQAAKGVIFNTITISDGISMGTEGMKYSLVSREVIADSIETVVGCEGMDGFVAIGGCDKNMPGCLMAMARMNRPAVFVYGGTILPGCGTESKAEKERKDLDVVFEAVGKHANGEFNDEELEHRRVLRDSRRRFLRRHVHREHHGQRDRGARHVAAEQLRASRHFR